MQHLIVKTSKVVSPKDPYWKRNGAGHKVNPQFGFGALDTGDLVSEAASKSWRTAMPQRICETSLHETNMPLKKGGTVSTKLTTDGCKSLQNCVTKLEHVHVIVTLDKKGDRGKLAITLISPSGTQSAILRPRVRDISKDGFKKWAFLTVFHWDEDPKGAWKLEIKDSDTTTQGKLVSWKLKFYGTCEKNIINPKNESEICNDACKQDCPVIFSDVCDGCSQYCDCTIGQCVPDCGELLTDSQLRHCKRSLDDIPNTNRTKISASHPALGISLYAKFLIIALALVIISVMIAGIAYFAAKMPTAKNLPSGYHSVSRYPCSDGIVDAHDEAEEVKIDPNSVTS